MENITHYLEDLNVVSVTVRLVLSVLFAGFIGVERQGQHHPAGMRTHILVCVGSTMTMMLGQYMFLTYGADPSRIGAQVVSGIGFLGVGTIMLNGGHVRGITTAAGLWASACMGLAIGAGFYVGALVGFFAIAFTLIVIRRMTKTYSKRHPRNKRLYLCLRHLNDLIGVIKLLRVWGVEVGNVTMDNSEEQGDDFAQGVNVIMDITIGSNIDSNLIMLNLLQEESVIYADYEKFPGRLFDI
ncbi:MAG: MgtC/SapB family protein [Oscillospiraceae bacterium]|nr:MgtC/SapB family protein [Oscillospiraceae bacterium]